MLFRYSLIRSDIPLKQRYMVHVIICGERGGPDLLYCYDMPDLPSDILQLESHFGRLRNHQHWLSGRKSTLPV